MPIIIVPKVEEETIANSNANSFVSETGTDSTGKNKNKINILLEPEEITTEIKAEELEVKKEFIEEDHVKSNSNVKITPKQNLLVRAACKNSEKTFGKKEIIKSCNSDAVQCEICEKVFRNNLTFGLHSIRHNNEKKYCCHMCKYKSVSKQRFSLHIKIHEGKAGFKCEICLKYFISSVHATEHKNFHTGIKPFHCKFCGKYFMFSKFLSDHQRNQHQVELTGLPASVYECLPCNKKYTCISGLKRHQQRYHSEAFDPSRLCDICGKRLASEDKLKFHRRIHTGEKPFVCAVCTKSFTRKDWLKEHGRIHTGERPYICSYCGKGFTQRSPLKIHVRSHTGEKPFVCRICNKGFTAKGTMDVHMRNCEGENFC